MGADLSTWLGGALGNQDTCMDGFEGTNTFVKTVVGGSLNQVTSLVREILGMIHQVPAPAVHGVPGGRKLRSIDSSAASDFPEWLKAKDRRLLQASGGSIAADAVVAADGSGDFTKVMDAISQVPDYNSRRFVIYVKKGVYQEYVEIGKKKTNIMMIGDGMDQTVITGNHNFIDGWTTYRSATFGTYTSVLLYKHHIPEVYTNLSVISYGLYDMGSVHTPYMPYNVIWERYNIEKKFVNSLSNKLNLMLTVYK